MAVWRREERQTAIRQGKQTGSHNYAATSEVESEVAVSGSSKGSSSDARLGAGGVTWRFRAHTESEGERERDRARERARERQAHAYRDAGPFIGYIESWKVPANALLKLVHAGVSAEVRPEANISE